MTISSGNIEKATHRRRKGNGETKAAPQRYGIFQRRMNKKIKSTHEEEEEGTRESVQPTNDTTPLRNRIYYFSYLINKRLMLCVCQVMCKALQ